MMIGDSYVDLQESFNFNKLITIDFLTQKLLFLMKLQLHQLKLLEEFLIVDQNNFDMLDMYDLDLLYNYNNKTDVTSLTFSLILQNQIMIDILNILFSKMSNNEE